MLFARAWFQLAINSSMKTTFGTLEISATFLYYNLPLETASIASFKQDSSTCSCSRSAPHIYYLVC